MQLSYIMQRKEWKVRRIGINECWDKGKKTGEGAQSQPLLMQMVTSLKESKEAKKVLFKVETGSHVRET